MHIVFFVLLVALSLWSTNGGSILMVRVVSFFHFVDCGWVGVKGGFLGSGLSFKYVPGHFYDNMYYTSLGLPI